MTPPGDGGITSITPSDRQPGIGISNEMKPKDGFDFGEFFRNLVPELFEGQEDKKPLPKVTEEQKKREEEDTQKGMPKKDDVVPEIKPKPKPDSKGGIADFDVPDTEREYRKAAGLDDPANKTTPEENKEIANDLAKLTGNEGKKDIPEWALPLASAGFAMMASKSPNFLQALGEAGQAGIATLSSQREAEEAKLDKAAERKYRNAMADFYEKGGSQSKGGLQAIGGKLYYKNTGEPYMIGAGDNQIHAKVELTRTDAIEILGKDYPGFLDIPNDDPRKEEIIQGYLNLVNGGNAALAQKVQNESTSEKQSNWWDNMLGIITKVDQYIEDAAKG